jgi:hypothetical protein
VRGLEAEQSEVAKRTRDRQTHRRSPESQVGGHPREHLPKSNITNRLSAAKGDRFPVKERGELVRPLSL